MQNGSSTLEARQHPNFRVGVDISPSTLVHSGFSSDQKSVQNTAFSVADGMGNQQYNNNLLSVKAERFGGIELYPESLELGNFMTLYNKQRIQDGMEIEFGIEDYELDHLHV